ncbi:MAG: response regulator transcription factor [Actinomycetota bacterium]|nr:response regulator transcription factor [Actinomycetota bacterium]
MKPRVLIVDDDDQIRRLVRRLLSDSGDFGEIYEAKDAAEGTFQARRIQPDVVVLDFNLPWMNGRTGARYLRRSIDVPIIGISGCLTAGDDTSWADAFVPKSGLGALVPTVKQLVGKTAGSGSRVYSTYI